MIFVVDAARRVQVSAAALAKMRAFCQHRESDLEAGGLLMGRLLHNDCLTIDDVTEPLPGDARSRFGFARRDPGHQVELDRRWQESGGRITTWGDWHTHAEPTPKPSPLDLSEWRRMAASDWQYEGDFLVFLIVGTAEVGAWQASRDRGIRALPRL